MDGTTPIERLTAGVHEIPSSEYHADPCVEPSLSSTIGKLLIDRSPLHAWTASPRLNPDWEPKNSATFDVGRAAHSEILGKGEGFAACPPEYLASNGAMSTKDAKAWIADMRDAGITPLKQDQCDAISAMSKVMREALRDLGLVIDPARSELTAISKIDGVWNRCMVDNAPEAELPGVGKIFIDLKTCESATDAACRKAISSYKYDFQDEHYTQVWRSATGERRTMVFLFQEKTEPFEVNALIPMREEGHSADWGETAKDRVREARRRWAHCLKTQEWNGYPRLIKSIGAPPWHRADWEQAQDTLTTAEAIVAARKFQEPKRKKS